MRYTKVSSTSYLVALVLLGVAAAFAAWRQHDDVTRIDRGAGSASSGREAFAAECASCHRDPSALSGSLGVDRDWRPLAELLLTGEALMPGQGETRTVKRHPTFEDSTDERLAAILDYVTREDERSGPASRVAPPTTTAVHSVRSKR